MSKVTVRLDEDAATELRMLIERDTWEAPAAAAADLQVSEGALLRAAGGWPVNPATRTLIEHGLERLRQEKGQAAIDGAIDRAEARSMGHAAPVCPRCLGSEPGTPGGTPDQSHPGPFSDHLCDPCSLACEAALRAEGRPDAADFEASQRAQRSR